MGCAVTVADDGPDLAWGPLVEVSHPGEMQGDGTPRETGHKRPKRGGARGGGSGGGPGRSPASLDTVGTTPAGTRNGPESRGSNGTPAGGSDGSRGAPVYRRAPAGRESSGSWRRYARAVAGELEAVGYMDVARRLRQCGTTCEVRACGACGDPRASITIRAGCDVRACVLCARRRAAVETARVGGAADRIAGYARERYTGALAAVQTELVRLTSQVRQTAAREVAERKARRAIHDLQGAHRWTWRLITLGPRWDPTDPTEYTPDALRRRVGEVRAAFARLWNGGLDAGGLGAAYLRVELSSRGHVHAHVLVYGPYTTQSWLQTTAGMIVDVRRTYGKSRGIREAVKYALKGPSPRGAWMGGESATCPHPRLAAAWIVATRNRRLSEPYGLFREALRAEDACDPPDVTPTAPRCATCGSDRLSDPCIAVTATVARAERERWTLRPRDRPGDIPLPARISFVRVGGVGAGPT